MCGRTSDEGAHRLVGVDVADGLGQKLGGGEHIRQALAADTVEVGNVVGHALYLEGVEGEAQAIEVFKNLGDAPEMTLALDRYGKPMVLLINLAQVDELE